METLVLVVYQDGDGVDKYQVHAVRDGDQVDVTDQYELAACDDDRGRRGFFVVRKDNGD